MDGLMSYRCFGRARSLRSDRAWLMFGRYAATKRDERSNLSVAGLGSTITSPFSAHETAFLHTSALKAVHAIESGVRPSPFPPDHLSVFPGHRGSLGHDHP
ncbi:hypothetical protein Bca52824_080345 [Brassica carinata]|uniref:Uncharacterized protein n=1 Tax=Brassica carinata TaxID=52824 RepID=A0A8X7PIH2_BRACI|nr:hypothetical protein Bca52824_080345 [Brassica carinata]